MSNIPFIKSQNKILELHLVKTLCDEHFEPSYTKFHPLIIKLHPKESFLGKTRYTPPSIKNLKMIIGQSLVLVLACK